MAMIVIDNLKGAPDLIEYDSLEEAMQDYIDQYNEGTNVEALEANEELGELGKAMVDGYLVKLVYIGE